MTILEALKSISNYPVPAATISMVAAVRGVELASEANIETLKANAFRLASADLMVWVADAPNVEEGGVKFNSLVSDREALRIKANAIYKLLGDASYVPGSKTIFGYKGENL